MTVCVRYPCAVCGEPCRFKRRRNTCSKTCAQIRIREGQLSGGAASAERAMDARGSSYIRNKTLFVPLTQGAYTKIDIRDAARVMRKRWYLFRDPKTGRKYAVREEHGVSIRLHRYLLNAPPSKDVDHVNGDGLDNRRRNLRKATAAQNARNARKRKNSTSRYKGVCADISSGSPWRARIRVDGRLIHLGRFKIEKQAARAYDDAARRLHGEFARINFPARDERSALR